MMKDYFLSIFSRDKVNTGRQAELDWFKAFALWAIIGSHAEEHILHYIYGRLFNSSLDYVISLIGHASGPFGFMVSMGATTVFSRSNSPDMLIRRGFSLIKFWLIVNLLKSLPHSISIFADSGFLISSSYLAEKMLRNDILCFAGLFFLYYGFLLKKGLSLKKIVLLSIIIYTAGLFIDVNLPEGQVILPTVLGYFVTTNTPSFVFVRWLPAPILGICWGNILLHCRNKDILYGCVGLLGIIGIGIILLYLLKHGMLHKEILITYTMYIRTYSGNLKPTIISILIFMLCLSIFYAFSRFVKWKPIQKIVCFLSENLTVIYIVQWVIIPILAELLTKYQGTDKIIIPIILTDSIFFVSCLCALALPKIKEKLKKKKTA